MVSELAETDGAEQSAARRDLHTGGVGRLLSLLSPAGPWAIRVAATLRLADLIESGVERLEELAAAAEVDADALGRLLRFLTCRDIFAEPEPGRFKINAAARLLKDDHHAGLRAWLDLRGAGGRMDSTWPALLESVRTGEPAYRGVRGRTFWEELAAEEELAASFDSLMASGAARSARDVIRGYDWSAASHVVDVGGGKGVLLAALLAARPHLRGTVVELPSTASAAESYLSGVGLGGRCAVAAGSFFEPLPAAADVYILSNVLHDWDDENALRILRGCASAAGARGRILVVERVLDAGNERDVTEDDLRFLLVFGGRARTLEQFQSLADATGMSVVSAARMPSRVSLLECAPRPATGRA